MDDVNGRFLIEPSGESFESLDAVVHTHSVAAKHDSYRPAYACARNIIKVVAWDINFVWNVFGNGYGVEKRRVRTRICSQFTVLLDFSDPVHQGLKDDEGRVAKHTTAI
jgi:hypothetical protein